MAFGLGNRIGRKTPAIVFNPNLQNIFNDLEAQGDFGGLRMFNYIVHRLLGHQKKMMADFRRERGIGNGIPHFDPGPDGSATETFQKRLAQVAEHVPHRFQFMPENLRRQFRSPFDRSTLALEGGDVLQRKPFEKRREVFEANFTLDNRAGSQRVLAAFQSAVSHGLEARLGVIRQGQASDLPLEFLEPAAGQFSILGFQRATKSLAALFDEGLIPTR